jgi:hypothetical protein
LILRFETISKIKEQPVFNSIDYFTKAGTDI